MPPRRWSRYTFCVAYTDANGRQLLNEPEPFLYREIADTRVHVVTHGDSLWNLAGIYFVGLPRPCGLWWVIADFQPEPIHDVTIRLDPGRKIYVPSVRTVTEEIFNESRRKGAVL